MFIKAYCVKVVVNMKPINLKEHVFSDFSLQTQRKYKIFYFEENVH